MADILSEARDRPLDEVPHIGDMSVEAACLGIGCSGLRLDTGHVGVCNSLRSEAAAECCEVLRGAGTQAGGGAA